MRNLTILFISLIITSCIHVSNNAGLQITQIDKGVPLQESARHSQEFWEAVHHLDLNFARTHDLTPAQTQFISALDLVLAGEYTAAQDSLEQLFAVSTDASMREHVGTLLTGLYTLTFDWDALIALDQQLPNGIDTLNTIAMVRAWRDQEAERIHFPAKPVTVPSEKSISGVPTIQVLVNGVEQTFWIDTGAEFTVLSSDIAEKCGVKPLVEMSSKVGTSTDKKIDLRPGLIRELKIGELVFENHPVFIINKEDLEFKLFKIIKILKIDGILGWNAIQNLEMELNYGQNTVTIQKPAQRPTVERNLHFLTQPFVTMADTNGIPLQFFLDTGANKTGLYEPSYAFIDTSSAERATAVVGGAGGMQKVTQLKFKDQAFILGQTRIDFPSIEGSSAMGDSEEGILYYDGILGSDVYKDGTLILDFLNGRLELIPGVR